MPHTYEANEQSTNFYPNLYNPANAAILNSVNNSICTAIIAGQCTGITPAAAFGTSPNPVLNGVNFYLNGIGRGGVNGIPKGLVNNHWANFGPRIGFAYDLTGQGKTVIRGGYGLMYERIQGNDMYNGATNPPGDLNPTLNGVSLSNPGQNLTNGSIITAAALPILPAGVTGIDSTYKLPRTSQYSLGVQQAIGARAVLSVSYVGSQNRHENYYQEINLFPQTDIPMLLQPGAPSPNQFMNYLGFSGMKESINGANGHYNSLQVGLHGNVTKDLQLQAGYTVSKAMDATTSTGSGGDLNNATNPYVGWQYDFGPSQFDRRQIAFFNYVYEIPFLRNSGSRLAKATLGGWELSGIVTMESGAPLNLGVSGSNASSVVPNSGNRPNVNGSIAYPKTAASWFNPAAFSAPACATGPDCYGNLGFDALRGPGRDNWNISLLKNFAFTERFKLQFRADAFNMWNHTQFKGDANNGGISLNQGSSNFGAVTAAFDPREFQLALKLMF